MKRKQFTDEQIVAALRDAEPSIHRWKKQYAHMEVSDVRELKRLKDENGCPKKLSAGRDLEVKVVKELQAKKW